MAVSVWIELVCEICASTTSGRFSSGGVPRRLMMEEAARKGWTFPEDRILCRKCGDK